MKLWLTLHRTSCAEGIPPLAESFFDGDERDREDMAPFVPHDLQFLHKVYIILLRAMVAMGKTNLQSIDCDVRVLRSLISIFDSQLLSLAPTAPSPLGKQDDVPLNGYSDLTRRPSIELCSYSCHGIPLLRTSNETWARCRRAFPLLFPLRILDSNCDQHDFDRTDCFCTGLAILH